VIDLPFPASPRCRLFCVFFLIRMSVCAFRMYVRIFVCRSHTHERNSIYTYFFLESRNSTRQVKSNTNIDRWLYTDTDTSTHSSDTHVQILLESPKDSRSFRLVCAT
jgi:hypothetical protein